MFKDCRNPSFAGSGKLVTLKEEVRDSLKKALGGQEEEDPLFENAGSSAGKPRGPRYGLPKLANAPETVSVDVLGVVVDALAPSSWRNEDVYVKQQCWRLCLIFCNSTASRPSGQEGCR